MRRKKTECNHIPISARLDGRSMRWSFLLQLLLFNINYCSFHTVGPLTFHFCSAPFSTLLISLRPPPPHLNPFSQTPDKVSVDGQKMIRLFEPLHLNFEEKLEVEFIFEMNLISTVHIHQKDGRETPLKRTPVRKTLCSREAERDLCPFILPLAPKAFVSGQLSGCVYVTVTYRVHFTSASIFSCDSYSKCCSKAHLNNEYTKKKKSIRYTSRNLKHLKSNL